MHRNVHGLPQERGRSVAGGKSEKRGPRHATSWTLRTRTGPRLLPSTSSTLWHLLLHVTMHSPFLSPRMRRQVAGWINTFDRSSSFSRQLSRRRYVDFARARVYSNETRKCLPIRPGLIDFTRRSRGMRRCARGRGRGESRARSEAVPVRSAD